MAARSLAVLAFFVFSGASFGAEDDAVVVTAVRDPVDKSYRRMVRGMDVFERLRGLAPNAELRYRLLPRKAGATLETVELEIAGDSVTIPVELAPDRTFTLERNRIALREDASVRASRKRLTMTWRADIRTPGLPPGTRRLGDLRLECEVGMAAGLVSNERSPFSRLAKFMLDAPDYCTRANNRYLFFAERPLWRVTLVSGGHREDLPADRLWGGATNDPDWKEDLPWCDCEVLMDRAYFLPLGDASWPDDTRVEFEYMDAPGGRTSASR